MNIETKWFPFIAVAIIMITFFIMMFLFAEPSEPEIPEEEAFVIKAFQNGDWNIPEGWRLYADEEEIGRQTSLLEYHENNWTSFPGELRNDTGPWKYTCILWFNTKTEQTYIQKMYAGDEI